MLRIFISYAKENVDHARKILSLVSQTKQHEVWLAEQHILGSTLWVKELEKRIRWCNLMVVVWSEDAKLSSYVPIEYRGAYEEGKPLLPCIVDNYVPDPFVSSFHYLRFDDYDFDRQLMEALYQRDSEPQLPRFVTVTLPDKSTFEIATTLVTIGAYMKLFTKHEKTEDSDDEFAVNNVSYADATRYCRWISEKLGQKFVLPTVSQWEFAAKANTNFEYSTFNGDISHGAVNHDGIWRGPSHVESNDKNRFGLYDMSGNLWEWCRDKHPILRDYYIVKGGSWIDKPENCRISMHHAFHRDHANEYTGFRLVREL